MFATEKNIAEFELRRADLESQAAKKLAESKTRAEKIQEIGAVTIKAIAGDEGKLFGSVGARELEEAIAAAGGDVSKNEISLPEGALRHLGEFAIDIQLHSDITETIAVIIEAE